MGGGKSAFKGSRGRAGIGSGLVVAFGTQGQGLPGLVLGKPSPQQEAHGLVTQFDRFRPPPSSPKRGKEASRDASRGVRPIEAVGFRHLERRVDIGRWHAVDAQLGADADRTLPCQCTASNQGLGVAAIVLEALPLQGLNGSVELVDLDALPAQLALQLSGRVLAPDQEPEGPLVGRNRRALATTTRGWLAVVSALATHASAGSSDSSLRLSAGT